MAKTLFAGLLVAILAVPSDAQPPDDKAVREAVEGFLLRLGDGEFDKVAADLAPKALVIVSRLRDGQWANSLQTGDEWVAAYELWDNGRNVPAILNLWRGAAAGIGAEVAVSRDGGVVRGIFESIDDTGRLIVRANDNSRIAISAGDVHFGVTASVRA